MEMLTSKQAITSILSGSPRVIIFSVPNMNDKLYCEAASSAYVNFLSTALVKVIKLFKFHPCYLPQALYPNQLPN